MAGNDTFVKQTQPPMHSCRTWFRNYCGSSRLKRRAGKVTFGLQARWFMKNTATCCRRELVGNVLVCYFITGYRRALRTARLSNCRKDSTTTQLLIMVSPSLWLIRAKAVKFICSLQVCRFMKNTATCCRCEIMGNVLVCWPLQWQRELDFVAENSRGCNGPWMYEY